MLAAFYCDNFDLYLVADFECYVIDPVQNADLNFHSLQNLKGKSLKVKVTNHLEVKNQNLGVEDKKTTVY